MKYEVIVELQKEVLDVEGKTILNTLKRLGFEDLEDIKVSKRFVVKFKNDSQKNTSSLIQTIANEYLANPVCENYKIKELNTDET